MQYTRFLNELFLYADESYKKFHSKLLKDESIKLIGVRTPILRNVAKKYKRNVEQLLSFPDEYYEVTFIKLTAVSYLTWTDFIKYIDKCVSLINNWSTCDCFKVKAIKTHRREFLPYVEKYLNSDKEFFQRYALVTLINYYISDEYLQFIKESFLKVDTSKYYVHMAVAWLVAEILVKNYDFGLEIIKSNLIDNKTKNKSIQKAVESFRLLPEQKTYLKTLKV